MPPTAIDSNFRGPFYKRVSWGAIFAGVVVVLVMQLMLGLLGLAFGAGSIDPLQEKNPIEGLGVGSAIWFGLTAVVSLFAGGWVSARFAAMTDRTEGALHGVVTWGLATLAMFYLIANTVGGVVTGAASVLGKTGHILGQGVKEIVPSISEAIGNQMDDANLSWRSVKTEVESLLRQTGKPELQPKSLKRQAKAIGESVETSAGQAARAPLKADNELRSLWTRIETRGDRILNAADEDALVNILVARTDMSRTEATETVGKWRDTLIAAKEKLAEMTAEAEQKARELGDATARTVTKAAAWSFVGLLIGMIAAAVGGYLGSPLKGVSTTGFLRQKTEPQDSAA